MRRIRIVIMVYAAVLAVAVSCTSSKPAGVAPYEQLQAVTESQGSGDAGQNQKILVSKGVIRSANTVSVFSRIEGQLLDVNLLEGVKVSKGTPLFRLDDWDLKGKVELDESECEQARLRMEEILVSQGYKRDNLDAAPARIKEYARIKSGLKVSERGLELDKAKLERAVIKAPMSGVITGVKVLSYAFVKPGETLCTIVDPNDLIVEFSILETELRRFELGREIEFFAIAYSDTPHKAVVRSIGSVVDDAGMVKVEATISEPGKLLPGMTVIVNM